VEVGVIRVITVEREYGSGGGGIAKRLADQLGWQLYDHSLTCEIARRLRCDVSAVEQREERCDTTFYRLMKTFMRGSYEDQVGAGAIQMLDAEHLANLFEKVICELADRGSAVVVGRGAPWFLRNRKDTFNLFVYAPREQKVERVQCSGHSRAEAEELVDRVDHERASFVKKYFNKPWPLRELYHMMLNSKVGERRVVDLVLKEIEILNAAEAAEPILS
jgi:cytidylate kinase